MRAVDGWGRDWLFGEVDAIKASLTGTGGAAVTFAVPSRPAMLLPSASGTSRQSRELSALTWPTSLQRGHPATLGLT